MILKFIIRLLLFPHKISSFGIDLIGMINSVKNEREIKPHEWFLTTFKERWGNFENQLKSCQEEFSSDNVHDLRVAARRLGASIEMARELDLFPRLKKVQHSLKEQIDGLDKLRDCQVMQAEVSRALENQPHLAPLQAWLGQREKRLLGKAAKQVADLDLSVSEKRKQKMDSKLEQVLARPEAETELLTAVDQIYQKAIKRFGQIDAAHPASIHRVRLAFKKFRYMVEIVQPVLPDFPKKQLKRLHDYQSLMGDVQDAESFQALLEKFAKKEPSLDLEPARRYFGDLHAEKIQAYMDAREELQSFWRSAPDQPFPWQSNSIHKVKHDHSAH